MNSIEEINHITYDIKQNLNTWEFVNVFKRKGLQAICGLLTKKIKTNASTQVVYKLSAHPDRVNEHEDFICSQTNKMRSFSPHFVCSYGSTVLPISNEFIEENIKHACHCENCKKKTEKKHTLFTQKGETRIRHVLFLEYVSNIHLKHALRTKDDQLISSQLILCLAAIQQGLDTLQFCHYDLHIDNVLLKECDPHSYFAYRFKNGQTLLCPTRGYYPVFIDFGTSHTYFYPHKEYKNKARVSIINSHLGLQPTLCDQFADIHQLIISALYECQFDSNHYYSVANHIMHYFRHIPMYRESGWKKCPFDVFKVIEKKIDEYEPTLETECSVWKYKRSQLIDSISLAITLPYEPLDSSSQQQLKERYQIVSKQKGTLLDELFVASFKIICTQLTNIQRSLQLSETDKGCKTKKDDLYYILREIVECKSVEDCKQIKLNYKMGKKCNVPLLYQSIIDCASILSHFYHHEFKQNEETLQSMYANVPFKSSIDIAQYLLQHVPCRPTKKGLVDVYCFDIQTMTTKLNRIDTTTYRPGKQWRERICSELF